MLLWLGDCLPHHIVRCSRGLHSKKVYRLRESTNTKSELSWQKNSRGEVLRRCMSVVALP